MVEFATGGSAENADDTLAGMTSEHERNILCGKRTRGWTGPETRGGRYPDCMR